MLLEHGADINAQNTRGSTPLIAVSVVSKDPEQVRLLLEHGANANLRDMDGSTALMYAVSKDEEPPPPNSMRHTIHLLLEHGASVNAQDTQGQTALYLAVCLGADKDCIDQLLAYGANPTLANKRGDTPTHCAQREWSKNSAVPKSLNPVSRLCVSALSRK